MKRFLALFLALTAVFTLALAGAPAEAAAAPADQIVFQLGHCDAGTDDNGYQIFAMKFRDKLEELSGGKISVEIISDSILGGERDLMEGLNLGTIEMAIVSNMYVSNFSSIFRAFDMPYIIEDYDTAVKVFYDEELRSIMSEHLLADNNTVLLSTGCIGFRHVINTQKPIEHPSDLAKMKIRVPETPVLVADFTAFGANCTTTAWSEAFTAVQQKTVDGLEVTTSAIYTGRFWEICSNMSLTKHMFQPLHLMVSTDTWNRLDEEQQGWIMEAAMQAGPEQILQIGSMEQRLLDEMNDAGCLVNEVNLDEFKEATADVYDKFVEEIGADFLTKVQELGA